MISLIICSRRSEIPYSFRKNIQDTIGVAHEFIVIDNSENKYSIFEAYNLGIGLSKGQLLAFIHDDIQFNTKNWGGIVDNIFSTNLEVGLLGVAGSTVKTKMPSTWWAVGDIKIRVIQHHINGNPLEDKTMGIDPEGINEVAAIDGVFMVMRKDPLIYFDNELGGFHNYDLDLSLKHHIFKKKVWVTSKIEVEHYSGGSINKDWYVTASSFHKKNLNYLPIVCDQHLRQRELRNWELINGTNFVMGLLNHDLRKQAIFWWYNLFKLKPISKFHFKILTSFLKALISRRISQKFKPKLQQ